MQNLTRPANSLPVLTDVALLLARLALGIILMAHGWQKFSSWTLAGTAESFEQMGAPAPGLSSALVATAELVGGGLLILGALTPLVALINVAAMIGAAIIAHLGNGIFVADGGVELVLAIGAGLLLLAVFGAGRFSMDGALRGAFRDTAVTERPAAPRGSSATSR